MGPTLTGGSRKHVSGVGAAADPTDADHAPRASAVRRPVMAVEMHAEPTQAFRFGKARTAQSAALLEDTSSSRTS